jgi:hypothetical protein
LTHLHLAHTHLSLGWHIALLHHLSWAHHQLQSVAFSEVPPALLVVAKPVLEGFEIRLGYREASRGTGVEFPKVKEV